MGRRDRIGLTLYLSSLLGVLLMAAGRNRRTMSQIPATAKPAAGSVNRSHEWAMPNAALWCRHCHEPNTEPFVPEFCTKCQQRTHWLMTKPEPKRLSLFTHDDWITAKVNRIVIEPEDLPS